METVLNRTGGYTGGFSTTAQIFRRDRVHLDNGKLHSNACSETLSWMEAMTTFICILKWIREEILETFRYYRIRKKFKSYYNGLIYFAFYHTLLQQKSNQSFLFKA